VIVASEAPVRIQGQHIAFLGGIKRTIPWSRPALGRVPSAVLVQDAARGTGAGRLVVDRNQSAVQADWSTKIVLQRSIDPALQTPVGMVDHTLVPGVISAMFRAASTSCIASVVAIYRPTVGH
jgi:hypothetical protein